MTPQLKAVDAPRPSAAPVLAGRAFAPTPAGSDSKTDSCRQGPVSFTCRRHTLMPRWACRLATDHRSFVSGSIRWRVLESLWCGAKCSLLAFSAVRRHIQTRRLPEGAAQRGWDV